ncbi:helix-turn-helix transcriptional regulator [Streptomyces sp. ZSW22]|uniref:helix-turn-helix domain-containing protein n=1 Tax=Streptomyces sp. ZSW22 TaxID=3055050 RepID=UPI0025B1FCBC|nr:helix-turn-helix transcriptional regulator [Streptomyces sp. ZSW22]MDN3244092.1 helix-turn-helix transcriptional regulator [Streptomyces sp. ZSW22]
MTTTPRDLDRLAQRVKRHRMEQYPSRDAAAEAAGITRNTWKRVEEGQEVRESTYAKIDKALGWAIGSCIAITEGGNPVVAEPGSSDTSAVAQTPTAAMTEEEARRAVFEAARAKMPASTPIGALDAFGDELVEILRRAGVVRDGD